MIFTCPACGEVLEKREKVYACPAGHSYDIAAEGYVHLLPPNHMHSKIPGDSKQMVASRRRFLESGLYEPFSDKLNELAQGCLAGESPVLLDAGCGEGYYTGRLAACLAARGPELYGFDISKFAVKAAAKRYKNISFVVASCFSIPAAKESADCLVNVFAPIVESEFLRVLKPGGRWILAVPSPRHLFGLKEILYDAPYENEYRETEYGGFAFERRVAVRDEIRITDHQTILDLFAMTPYYWKTPASGGERLAAADSLTTEIGFDYLIYRKEGA